MANPLLTPRDEDIFRALDGGPLTVRQLLKLSSTFCSPFGSERRLQDRLRILANAGLVHRWPYLTGDRSVVFYYTLSTQSFRLLHGQDEPPPRGFGPVGVARQHHTRCLAEFRVHTVIAARSGGFNIVDVYRENTLRLEADGRSLYPDLAFTLHASARPVLQFFVELDNGTEPITSPRERDSWLKKLTFYESLRDTCGYRFRVLGIVTKSQARLEHILMTAAAVSHNPQRSLFYGTDLTTYLAQVSALENCFFRNHKGQLVSMVPPIRENPATDVPEVLSVMSNMNNLLPVS